jgi:hypothetical protein
VRYAVHDRAPDDPSVETQALPDDAFGVWGLAWTPSATIDGALELTRGGGRREVLAVLVKGRADRGWRDGVR